MKRRYYMGVEVIECSCGVWRVPSIPCWNETDRPQLFVEAGAAFAQSIRNLGYEVLCLLESFGRFITGRRS